MNPEWRTSAIGLVLLEASGHSQVVPEPDASALCYTEEKLHPEFRKESAKRPASAKKTCCNALCQPAAVPALLPSLCWDCMLDRGSWMRKFLWFSTFTQPRFMIPALALPYSLSGYHNSLCGHSPSLIKREGKPVLTDTFYISCMRPNVPFTLSPPWISWNH